MGNTDTHMTSPCDGQTVKKGEGEHGSYSNTFLFKDYRESERERTRLSPIWSKYKQHYQFVKLFCVLVHILLTQVDIYSPVLRSKIRAIFHTKKWCVLLSSSPEMTPWLNPTSLTSFRLGVQDQCFECTWRQGVRSFLVKRQNLWNYGLVAQGK